MPRKQFTLDETVSKIAADIDLDGGIIIEDKGCPSSYIENSCVNAHVDNVHTAPDPDIYHLSAVHGLGRGVRCQNMTRGRRGQAKGVKYG